MARDRPEACDGTTSTSIGGQRTQQHRSERRGWDCVSKEREARVGACDNQEREANIAGWGHVRGDGCGGKCGVERTDGRTVP